MITTRETAAKGSVVKLQCILSLSGQAFTPSEVMDMKLIDEMGTEFVIAAIDILNPSPGVYEVLWEPDEMDDIGTYNDVWQFVFYPPEPPEDPADPMPGPTVTTITQTFFLSDEDEEVVRSYTAAPFPLPHVVTRDGALPGNTVQLYVQFFNDHGYPADPDSVEDVVINVRNEDVATIAPVREGLGKYYVLYDVPVGSLPGECYDTWTYTWPGGLFSTTKQFTWTIVSGGYYTVAHGEDIDLVFNQEKSSYIEGSTEYLKAHWMEREGKVLWLPTAFLTVEKIRTNEVIIDSLPVHAATESFYSLVDFSGWEKTKYRFRYMVPWGAEKIVSPWMYFVVTE